MGRRKAVVVIALGVVVLVWAWIRGGADRPLRQITVDVAVPETLR